MGRSLVILLLLVSTSNVLLSAQGNAPAPAEVLTLDDAVRRAAENNRGVKNALLSAAISDDQIAEAKTYRYPSVNLYAIGSELLTPVDFTFDKGIFGTFPGIGPIPAENTKIHSPRQPTLFGVAQLVQPLSQQYKIGLNIRLAGLSRAFNDQKVRAQRQAVANQVRRAYYGVQQTQSALEVSEEALKLDRELIRIVQQGVEQGTVLKADSLDSQAKLAQQEYDQQRLQDSLATQKEQLNSLLGRDIRTDFAVNAVPEITLLEMDLEAARSNALASRPELQQARLAVQQAELNRRITKAGYIPDVSLTVNNLSLGNVSTFLPSNVASAGILLNWNPIDWGKRKHELAEATKTIEQSKNSVNDTESQILVDVGDKFRKLQQSRLLLRASDLGLQSARERLRVTMNQYEQKAALVKDVLQQKAAMQSATDQYQQAVLAFWTAKADFDKALGEE